jgi:hypothetical protein
MLYCLRHQIQFILFSKDANFGYRNGWTDYFLPFCDENTDDFHSKYNFRRAGIFKTCRPQVLLYHLFHRNTFLTFEILNRARDRRWEKVHFDIPELGINGNLRDACRVLINMTWRYNSFTQEQVQNLITSLHLPEHYIGFHVRMGDKITETNLFDVEEYIKKMPPDYPVKNAFVLTDNYLVIEQFQRLLNDWNIYTLCGKEERGYFHQEFQKQQSAFIRKSHETLFASMDILSESDLFIGTFNSNPGIFMGMKMDKQKVFGVDKQQWCIV